MNTVTHLARHMLSFEPNKDAARLSLYHYLIHHCDREAPLTPQLFENFCRTALVHQHWQNHPAALSQELQYILQHYNETYGLDWNLKDYVFPDHWQVVSIKNSIEGLYIFEKWAEKQHPKEAKSRVFCTKNQNYVVLTRFANQEVMVTQSSPHMLIQKGELQPLCMSVQLHYNEHLELKPNHTHFLKVDNNSYARFRVHGKNLEGMIIRGYIFQNKAQTRGEINDFPEIYYPLKQLEQYYIDKRSDPDYQELIQVLEKSVELLGIHHPEALSFAQAALERGRSVLENIFIQDNVIQTLVDQLAQELRSSHQSKDVFYQLNSSYPSAESP